MKPTAFDGDEVLTGFLTDYLDEKLDTIEVNSFEGYLSVHPAEKAFAEKAAKGKKALEYMRKHMKRPIQLA